MSGNGEKKEKKRDDQGRFMPGSKGGPGRGYRKKSEIDLDTLAKLTDLNAAEALIRHDMTSGDYRIRQKATAEMIRLLRFKDAALKKEKSSGPSAFVIKLGSLMSSMILHLNASWEQVLDSMLVVCPGCEKLGFKNDVDIDNDEDIDKDLDETLDADFFLLDE